MSHDTWAHRMVRPAVRPLARTAIAPNHLTWLRIVSGIAAAVALAQADRSWLLAGSALFLASFLLDRADGELARLSGKASAFGHKLDLVGDGLCNALAFVGLGLGLRHGGLGPWAILMGLVAGLSVVGVLAMVWRIERLRGERSGELSSVGLFDVDDAILAVPVFIWLGLEEVLLILAAVSAPLVCGGLIIKLRRRL